MKFLVVFVTIIGLGSCAKLPSDFQRCKKTDANFNPCLRQAIEDAFKKMANGIPDLNVPALEPLNIPSATIGQGTGPVNVEQKYKDIKVYNLINSKIENIETKLEDNKLTLVGKISAPEYILKADYDFNGKILLLPIVGAGKCTITLSDVMSEMTLMGEKFEKKGKTYMEMKEFKINLKPGKVTFNFENLFNGDERLGKEMNNVLNENWNEVFGDVKVGYEELLSSIGKLIANNIFMKVPYDEIILP